MQFWLTQPCAMTSSGASLCTFHQSAALNESTGVALILGSEVVWWREGKEMIKCNRSFCRHATQYPDGAVVDHAPAGQSILDGAFDGQVEMDKQLAAFTYLTWMMSDANMLEAVVHPPSWPNSFAGTFVKPSPLVPNIWTPDGWRDPAVSMFRATTTSNMHHPNAYIGLRLPNAFEY